MSRDLLYCPSLPSNFSLVASMAQVANWQLLPQLQCPSATKAVTCSPSYQMVPEGPKWPAVHNRIPSSDHSSP